MLFFFFLFQRQKRFLFLGGNSSNLGEIDGINQWEVLTANKTNLRTEITLEIDELENLSGIIAHNGRYKLINGKLTITINNN